MYSPINEPPVNLPSYSNYDFFMIIKQILFFCLSILILSCDSNNHIRTYSLPKGKTNNFNLPSIKRETATSGFVWEKPDSWIPSEGSSMRLASFKIPYSVGYGDLSVIQLSGAGGGIESNVNRWRRQLNLEPQSLDQMKKSILIRSSALGDYKIIKIINDENKESAFLCAILEIKQSTIFIKMNASIEGINQLEDDFITFCSSFN